jgi:hypothetical protein
MVQVQVNVVLVLTNASALEDLLGHGPGDDVPGGQVLGSGCVSLHKPLAQAVSQDSALSSAALGHEAAGAVDSGGVELDELEVLHGQALADDHGAAVAGAGVRGGAGLIGSAVAAGGEAGVAGPDSVDGAVGDVHAHDAPWNDAGNFTCRRPGRRR